MDSSLRLASLTAFYFGARVATTPVEDPTVIDRVSQRAYRDLNRTLHGIGTHPDKNTLLEGTHQSLREFIADLTAVDSRTEFDTHHDTWCQKRIDVFTAHPRADREFIFTYGHAQKWLNMTMKYLAVLGHSEAHRLYGYLHVPIDSIIYDQADQLGVPRPQGKPAWSRLSHSQYVTYQGQLRTHIAQQTPHTAPLDWEATAWMTRPSPAED